MARSPQPRQDRRWITVGAIVIAAVVAIYALTTWWAYEDDRGSPTGEVTETEAPITPENPPAAQ